MQQMGMKHKRIRALTADEVTGNMTTFHVSPAIQQTPHELACVASHLVAIHSAVHDETIDPTNPYALIVEDDVSFEMDVDFKSLATSAPKDFGILQLMTSNSHEVGNLWGKYIKKKNSMDLWTRRSWDSGYWSTQGYLVNKANVKEFIDKAVKQRPDGSYDLHIINPAPSKFQCRTGGGRGAKCRLPFRIVADIYIFTGCGPTYMANIPIFNGAHVGQNSTIHYRKNNDVSHAKSFAEIATVLNQVRNSTSLIPPFIRKKTCKKK
jgi:GR25 family glycosyltransferase involved in LPS biosynthesis